MIRKARRRFQGTCDCWAQSASPSVESIRAVMKAGFIQPSLTATGNDVEANTWNHKSVLRPILRDGHFVTSSG